MESTDTTLMKHQEIPEQVVDLTEVIGAEWTPELGDAKGENNSYKGTGKRIVDGLPAPIHNRHENLDHQATT